MAKTANSTRRTFIKAFPFVGLAAAAPIQVIAAPSPDERIAHAQEIIRQALAEKYSADWEIEVNSPNIMNAIQYKTNETFQIGEVLVISALDPKFSYGRKMTAIYDERIELPEDRKRHF